MKYNLNRLKPFGIILSPKNDKSSIKDIDVEYLKYLIKDEQLIVLRGFNTFINAEDFSDYCQLWGEISLWPFGKVLELIEQENPEDHIFDHSYVPLHWDGMYREYVPEFQIFHCVKAPEANHGGKTTFSHTMLALENASPELKKNWENVYGIYLRKMEFYHSKVISPIICKHPYRDYSVIRYNEPSNPGNENFINPPDIKIMGVSESELENFHQSLTKALYSTKCFYAHEWQNGDVVITDNFSLLHGREEFVSKSPRHLQRVQVLSNPPFHNPGLESYQ